MLYIGETKRALATCLKEHQAATKLKQEEKSAIAEHAHMREPRPAWDKTIVLEQARNDNTLCIKEALCIMMAEQQHLLNRDKGTAISECWKPILCCIGHQTQECLQTLTLP